MGKRPNFLVIVADDLGFSDCSCFGSEIQTPNIDDLAADGGIRFTSFHVAAACSPTRSMLMTGTDHHIAGLGQLAEFVRKSPAHQGQPGHEGYLNERVVALPELLRDGGYWTVISGKWHLGLQKKHAPVSRGFEKSFALLPGCSNHFGYEPQYEDPVEEPPAFFETAVTALHIQDNEYVTKLPEDFYSSDFYASKLIDFMSERTPAEKEKPFFAYLPFSAPHWPLQAPEVSVRKYRGMYNDGPEALRQRRLDRLKQLGLVSAEIKPHDVVTAPGEQKEWGELTSEERAKSARSMETYAGMVDRMDENIGRVIAHLKETGEYDNTFIYFMSDNGAEGASYEAMPIVGDDVVAHINKYYDNSLDNIGRKNSFVWYGSRWAQSATAPSRLFKMFSTEGGCRVPLVLKVPGRKTCVDKKGDITDSFCTVLDFVPTILDLAGLEHPGSYKGRQVAPLRGISWRPYLENLESISGSAEIHDRNRVFGFECAGSAAIRRGSWKITFVPFPRGPQRWELFNIERDPGETTDLSLQEPQVFLELLEQWDIYQKEVGVVGLAGQYPAPTAADQFEDIGKWIRFIGRKDIPPQFVGQIPG